MKITEVKISLMPGKDPLKAFASIIFDDCFVVHDLRVIRTGGKTFVAMPSKKIRGIEGRGDSYKDVAHPIKPDMRSLIENSVLEKYEQVLKSMD